MDKDLIAAEADFLADLPQQLDAYKKDRSHLIPILQMIQKEIAFLPT